MILPIILPGDSSPIFQVGKLRTRQKQPGLPRLMWSVDSRLSLDSAPSAPLQSLSKKQALQAPLAVRLPNPPSHILQAGPWDTPGTESSHCWGHVKAQKRETRRLESCPARRQLLAQDFPGKAPPSCAPAGTPPGLFLQGPPLQASQEVRPGDHRGGFPWASSQVIPVAMLGLRMYLCVTVVGLGV